MGGGGGKQMAENQPRAGGSPHEANAQLGSLQWALAELIKSLPDDRPWLNKDVERMLLEAARSKAPALTATGGYVRLTNVKTADIASRGYSIVGYVLRRDDSQEICISAESAVRWLAQNQYWRLMHEQDGSLFATVAPPASIQMPPLPQPMKVLIERPHGAFFKDYFDERLMDEYARTTLAQNGISTEEKRDAQRWRALLGSQRIRCVGSLGINSAEPDGFATLSLELWTKYSAEEGEVQRVDYENKVGREWLEKYADIAAGAKLGDR